MYDNQPVAVIMVGLPACGKSTRVEQICKMDPDAFVYSTDNYIETIANDQGLTYNEVFSATIGEAQKNNDNWLAIALANRQLVVFDQTNLGKKKRRKIFNKVKQAGYRVVVEFFVAPYGDQVTDWIERLQSRPGKVIPTHVLSNMIENIEDPREDQLDYDQVKVFNIYGKRIDEDAK